MDPSLKEGDWLLVLVGADFTNAIPAPKSWLENCSINPLLGMVKISVTQTKSLWVPNVAP